MTRYPIGHQYHVCAKRGLKARMVLVYKKGFSHFVENFSDSDKKGTVTLHISAGEMVLKKIKVSWGTGFA